jgi:hypothetical protein
LKCNGLSPHFCKKPSRGRVELWGTAGVTL